MTSQRIVLPSCKPFSYFMFGHLHSTGIYPFSRSRIPTLFPSRKTLRFRQRVHMDAVGLEARNDQAFSVFSSSSVNGTGSPTSVIALSAASCCG